MKPKIIICDIDGVLADNTHRLYPHNATSYEDSFSRVIQDNITEHADWICSFIHHTDIDTVYITGRSISCKKDTEKWLVCYGFNFEYFERELIMRPLGDKRPSVDFKEEETKKLMQDYDIVLAIDDDIRIIEMYRKLGLNTLHVNNIGKQS